jgi:hypothetical protein
MRRFGEAMSDHTPLTPEYIQRIRDDLAAAVDEDAPTYNGTFNALCNHTRELLREVEHRGALLAHAHQIINTTGPSVERVGQLLGMRPGETLVQCAERVVAVFELDAYVAMVDGPGAGRMIARWSEHMVEWTPRIGTAMKWRSEAEAIADIDRAWGDWRLRVGVRIVPVRDMVSGKT